MVTEMEGGLLAGIGAIKRWGWQASRGSKVAAAAQAGIGRCWHDVGVRPPDCYVCRRTSRDFPDDDVRDWFTLIYFGETEAEKLGPRRPEGWAGHRPNAVWFCHDHATFARQHENRHYDDAEFGQFKESAPDWRLMTPSAHRSRPCCRGWAKIVLYHRS